MPESLSDVFLVAVSAMAADALVFGMFGMSVFIGPHLH